MLLPSSAPRGKPIGYHNNGGPSNGSLKQRNNNSNAKGGSTAGGSGIIRRYSTLLCLFAVFTLPSFLLGTIWTRMTGMSTEYMIHKLLNRDLSEEEITKLCNDHTNRVLEHHEESDALHAAANMNMLPLQSVGRYAVAMSRVSKEEFTSTYDMGVPLDPPSPGAEDVLILYSNDKAMPSNFGNDPNTIPQLSISNAVEHCDYMNIILTDHGRRNQCMVIVPQYESFHIQKWMRVSEETEHFAAKLNSALPLRMVSRGHTDKGRENFAPPELSHTRQHWTMLSRYFDTVDDVLKELKLKLDAIAIDNTVIVMVCNFGQSELLMNFVCSAHNHNLDTKNIIVFTTDQETTDLVEALGLTAFYDERNFGDIPTEAARRYGDAKFVAMMMAKVICVQLVSMLGYNFLFQDVDIVWYKHPLEYFHNAESLAQKYDVFFQDDGGHSVRYAPYSANSGFYYVKYNDRTRHFLTSLLMAGDLILKTDSHQQALIATLNEHVSLYGLKAKVLSRDMEEFPGGYQFHQHSKVYMKQFYAGEMKPYIFHMSWTLNKNNKLLFLRQMGEWYVNDQCIQVKASDIHDGDEYNLVRSCCSAEPLFSCHYRDKPSLKPCKSSPPIDKGRQSWW